MRAGRSIASISSHPGGLALLVAAALLLGVASPASATLIGDDEVTFELDVTVVELGSIVLSQTRVMGPVGAGVEDSFLFTPIFLGSPTPFDILIEVDIMAEGLTVRAVNQTGGGRGAIGVVARFTGLDWTSHGGDPGVIASFTVDSEFDQVVSTSIIDAGRGIEVEVFDEGFQRTDDLLSTVDLTFAVPEPAPLVLATSALALAGVRRRGRLRRAPSPASLPNPLST
jgi:hypothetical protein